MEAGGVSGRKSLDKLATPMRTRADQSTANTLDERITLLKRLKSQRDEIDSEITTLQEKLESELSSLIGLVQPGRSTGSKPRATRKCSICGLGGHNAATCKKKASFAGKSSGSKRKLKAEK